MSFHKTGKTETLGVQVKPEHDKRKAETKQSPQSPPANQQNTK